MHQTWSCDFLQLYDIWFQPIFAFFIIDLGSRQVVHVGVTRNPTTTWVAQQLRNATPFGEGPRFLIRDSDDKFGVDFDRAAKGAGVRVLRTAVRAPLMNSYGFSGVFVANAWTTWSCSASVTWNASCESTASGISIRPARIKGSVSSCLSGRRPPRAVAPRSWPSPCSRVHDVDALACPCGGRLKFVEVVTEADPQGRVRALHHGDRSGVGEGCCHGVRGELGTGVAMAHSGTIELR
jgi:hypothetical protein